MFIKWTVEGWMDGWQMNRLMDVCVTARMDGCLFVAE